MSKINGDPGLPRSHQAARLAGRVKPAAHTVVLSGVTRPVPWPSPVVGALWDARSSRTVAAVRRASCSRASRNSLTVAARSSFQMLRVPSPSRPSPRA